MTEVPENRTGLTRQMDQKTVASISKHSNRSLYFIAALALVLGGAIYIFIRSSEFVFFRWIETIGFGSWLETAREHALSDNSHFPEWIVYSLPNGLWAFAYTLIITRIWSGSKSWIRYVWMATIPVLVFGFEVLQYTGTIPGTYCKQDLAMASAGLILGCFIGIYSRKIINYEKR